MPILKTVRRLKDMALGGRLTILSDDPLAEQDLIDLCDSPKYDYNFHSIHHDGYIEFTICIPPYEMTFGK